MIGPGADAPSLVAENQFGVEELLSNYLGEWVVLWWYPKAMTPGCTSCGKAFLQAKYDFDLADCQIVGVSFDSPDDNLDFAKKYDFDFPLLSATREDAERWMTLRSPDSEWAAYPQRISYLIDPSGTIVRSYKVGDPHHHPQEVLSDLRKLQAERAEVARPNLLGRLFNR